MAKAKAITGLDPHVSTGYNAQLIAKMRLAEMYSWERYVDNQWNVRELHDLRIAVKRVRYTLEVFEEVLPAECQRIVEELQRLQEELGSLHDCDVLMGLLRVCLARQGRNGKKSAAAAAVPVAGRERRRDQEVVELEPGLVAALVARTVTPSAEERYGLQRLLVKQEQLRETRYAAFREHWEQLQARDFRGEILAVLDV